MRSASTLTLLQRRRRPIQIEVGRKRFGLEIQWMEGSNPSLPEIFPVVLLAVSLGSTASKAAARGEMI